ncbi:MAG: MBL fold metallo-hydrolase [Deltaproteobacteria bacterium]
MGERSSIDLRVLGCHGGQLPGHRTTCFLLDGKVALDGGALCEALPLDQLLAIDHVVLTHSHFDHIQGIPLLADLLIGQREEPVTIHGSPDCIETLRRHLFNDRLWPDFTKLPTPKRPVLKLEPFKIGRPFKIGPYTISSQLVNHPVEAVGLLVEKGGSSLAMSGDTGPTEALWEMVNGVKKLGALFVESSFPDALAELATASGHLTPQTLRAEVESRLRLDRVPIHVYHLKPAYSGRMHEELAALRLPGLRVLENDDELRF